MAVKLGSNISSLTAQRLLSVASGKVYSAAERLASGQRINQASDDAAGLAISTSLNANSRILAQGLRNISDTISLTSVSEGAMHELEQITVRQKELAEQSANGVYSSKQRSAMDIEARALTNEYNRIILTTKFNGQAVLSNSWEELRTQAGVGVDNSLAFKFADELATKVTPGSYFNIDAADGRYYVWYTVDGVGTDPHADGTGIQVALHSQSTAGTPDTPATTAVVQISNLDANSYNDGDMFYISSPNNKYYVWFDLDGNYGDPGDSNGEGATGVRVLLTAGQTSSQVSDRIITELQNTGEFTGQNFGNGDVEIYTVTPGPVLFDAYTWQGATGASQQGSGSALIPGTAVNQTLTGDQIRDAVATALSATGKFSTQVASDGSLRVTNTVSGRAVDITDYNSGNIITDRLTQGTGPSFLSFGSPGDSSSWMMKAADLNGDGAPDIVSSDYGTNTIGVRLNDGTGEFGSETSYAMGGGPTDLELVDINGDGKLDVVNTNYSGASVTVRMGVGDGTFGSASTYSIYANSVQVSVGDLNGDGRPDLATSGSNGVNILLNQGNGTFGAAATLASGGEYVELGDIDHDGKLDMVTTTYSGTAANVRLGNGNGTFKVAVSYSLGGVHGSNATVLKDVNNDGWLDFATTAVFEHSASVLINNRAGGFSAANVITSGFDTAGIDFADLNNDGNLDLITGDYSTNIVTMHLGNGNGTFKASASYSIGAVISAFNGIYKITTADLDGDGNVDILANDSGRSRLAMLWGNGTTALETPRAEVTRLFFGDARGMTLINQIDLTTRRGALRALDTLDTRLDRIHRQIGVMGAVTSRLHSALQVTATRRENFIAAESRIKDADIASESAAYTNNQIKQQVAQSVLAQANQIPALALTLLR